MCVVSMVGDHFNDKWRKNEWIQYPYNAPLGYPPTQIDTVPKHEFDALKKEVEDMKALLKRAKEYDERNNEPNCEIEEKMKFLRYVASLVGIDLSDVIPKEL